MTNNKLKHVSAYLSAKENTWFLALQYEYSDNNGLHQVYFPKVELPISQNIIPIVHNTIKSDLPPHYIETFSVTSVDEGEVKDPRDGQIYNHVYMADILVEPKVKKMTLAEIEKKLGYKIEIVSKKE